jgi:hypothetical protein
MLVSDPSQTEVSSSQVQASSLGTSVVAWNGTDQSTGLQSVFFQRFGPRGHPIGRPRLLGHQASGRRRLVKLLSGTQGSFRLRSERFGADGSFLGLFEQGFHSDGNEDGNDNPVSPDS